MPLSAAEKEKIQSDLLDEVFGLGPLEALLRDPQGLRHPGEQQRRGVTSSAAANWKKRTSCSGTTGT